MFRKTTMAALVAAIAILGVVVVLQTGGGGPMRSMQQPLLTSKLSSRMVEAMFLLPTWR